MPYVGDAVATRLEKAIGERKISIRALARALGKDRSQVQKWKRGQTVPDDHNAKLLADFFGKPADYFVTPRVRKPTQAERIAALEEEIRKLREDFGHPDEPEGQEP